LDPLASITRAISTKTPKRPLRQHIFDGYQVLGMHFGLGCKLRGEVVLGSFIVCVESEKHAKKILELKKGRIVLKACTHEHQRGLVSLKVLAVGTGQKETSLEAFNGH
jgi:hypothetical protein